MNKDEGRQLVGISALRFLQCFDTVGWVTGRTSGLKDLCHFPQSFSSGSGGERKLRGGELAN